MVAIRSTFLESGGGMMGREAKLGASTPDAPDLRLIYAGEAGLTAVVLALPGTLAVTQSFDGTAGNAFPVGGFVLCGWLRTAQPDAGAVVMSYGASSGTDRRIWITNPANLALHYGVTAPNVTGVSIAD